MIDGDGMPVVGMVGGGQLARMTHQAAIGLGVRAHVLSDSAHASAALVSSGVSIGDHRVLADLRAFAAGCDVVTFDHEHVPGDHIAAMEAAGIVCRPGAAALLHAQDKRVMRERLTALGVPCPRFAVLDGPADTAVKQIEAFAELVGQHSVGPAESPAARRPGWPIVLKATRGGYDGRGVWICDSVEQARPVVERMTGESPAETPEKTTGEAPTKTSGETTGDVAAGVDAGSPVPLLVEEHVAFRRELAALVARSPYGQGAAYPIVQTVQRDGVCHEVIAPAPGLDEEVAVMAQRLALDIAADLGVVGLLAVEMFEVGTGVLVNELAMRPHNSGHWTIEGARTSQFEQHLRAVLDLPLGDPTPTAPYTVMANVLGGAESNVYPRYIHVMARDPAVKVHFYGKEVRPGRKIGHVTALGDDLDDVRERARHAAAHLMGES